MMPSGAIWMPILIFSLLTKKRMQDIGFPISSLHLALIADHHLLASVDPLGETISRATTARLKIRIGIHIAPLGIIVVKLSILKCSNGPFDAVGAGRVDLGSYLWGHAMDEVLDQKHLAHGSRRQTHVQVKHFQPYLYGRHFTVLTDHAALRFLMTSNNLGGRLLRWSVALREYTFTIHYRLRRLHANADALSRLPQPDNTFNLSILGELIYKVDPNGKQRLVPPPEERLDKIKATHEQLGHYGARRVYDNLRLTYFWTNMDSQDFHTFFHSFDPLLCHVWPRGGDAGGSQASSS
ncbi:hypothetical protein WJX73_000570 [Symbiochloris irregularis]|uniref:Reverse transcriptase RNase H-like domain-containing protein n=1 Tax=Symbiochloris irregularis TaxID=706552 RepID=A0AAW1NUP0_9CHLO